MPELLWRVNESPGARLALSPLLLAEAPYRAGAWLHRFMYEAGLRARTRLDARVVSVGNLAVGGSAKTPVAAFLARSLAARGRRVALLSRGVGGRRAREVNVVSDGARILMGPLDAGDEPCLLAASAPGVPVLAGANRVALGLHAQAAFGAEVLVLDDGFQHHRLERDVDLVCLDARLGLGNGHVLPRGPLREPTGALSRADALVVTRASANDGPLPGADRLPPGLPLFHVAIAKVGLRPLGGGALEPLSRLRGARAGFVAAIARPDRLARELDELGAELVARRVFRDHHPYRPEDLAHLDPTLLWVTTAKDAVKLPPAWLGGTPLYVLDEEVDAASAAPLVELVARRVAR